VIATKQTILDYLAKNLDNFHMKYGVEKIGLFGSYARGEATNESDIDVYVHMTQKNLSAIAGLWAQLEADLNTKIDLVTAHNHMRPGLKEAIENEVMYV